MPQLIESAHARVTPSPSAAHCWSPPALTTGSARGWPSSAVKSGAVSPQIAPGGTISQSFSGGAPNASSSRGDQRRVYRSSMQERLATDSSVTKRPVIRCSRYSWTPRNLYADIKTSGSFCRSHRIFGPVYTGVGRMPQTAYGSYRSSTAAHSGSERLSCHMMASRSAPPFSSTAISDDRCEASPTPASSIPCSRQQAPAAAAISSSAERKLRGSCSTRPPWADRTR